MKLSLTGITSGVGMRLAELALAQGHELSALVRDPTRSDAQALSVKKNIRLIRGDLENKSALVEVAKGADAFVHLAAHVGDQGDRETFERVNVGGTARAIEACAEAGVPRFVHMSSTAVYGRPDRGRVTEEWPTRKIGMPYEDTKTDAERIAFERGRTLGLEVNAIRPPLIYGDNDKNFMPRAVDSLRKHRFLLVDGGRAPLNVVWADHVAQVTLLAAEKPGVSGEAFNVMDEVDRRPPTVREVAETIAREAGLPKPRISLPYPVAMALAHGVEKMFHAFKPNELPPISPFVVKILTRHVIYDASKAVRMLGWKPQMGALEGIAKYARTFAGS